MTDMVSVPAEKIAALREAYWQTGATQHAHLRIAARAVVDAVETEDEPKPRYTRSDKRKMTTYSAPLAPSPARNDAETVIAGLLAEHVIIQYREVGLIKCWGCDWQSEWPQDANAHTLHRAHVASVIAAHMAAPDELTALGRLADKWRNCDCWDDCHCKDLHAALGDA